jgi:DNA-binding response OmpR family regulator
VRRRAQEFWAAEPSAEDVARSRLAGQPLLADRQLSPADHSPISPDNADLTASEHRLLAYLQAHPAAVCAKDDLIGAVWPEDRLVAGLRDDSLAQLVRRLRQKVEPDPAHPQHILTVPGRGYRFIE